MGFSCGIVGMPNVGKSTIFNALSKAQIAESANYPFCTIDPNKGVVPVPDSRLDFIVKYVNPRSVVHTTVEFVDIAGLVRGAGKGEGLGNQFLMHIRQVDAIVHVVRCFEDENVAHVEGSVDPLRDISIIQNELMISDIDVLERALERARKASKGGGAALKRKADVLAELTEYVSGGKLLKDILEISPEYREEIKEYQLLTDKPVLYAANVSEEDIISGNSFTEMVQKAAAKENAKYISICGKIECDILELGSAGGIEYLAGLGLKRSGLEILIYEGYDLLGLVTFFTAGEKEARAWTIKKNTIAREAAGKIHSDIERGFIRAEVVSFKDFAELKSLAAAKEKGKMRLEGKEYVVQDGDIIYFRHNV
ncbi:MAG: redox-regulated ATPase YchF [Deferribacteraceae bacterium]|jgi:GTP-binding protein YchF|nr:redox-regulated ATPase YchF [Deferribacteraceae bacterium]